MNGTSQLPDQAAASAFLMASRCQPAGRTDCGIDHDQRINQSIDASAAAAHPGDAERVGVSVLAQTDFRAHALIQGWAAAALFVHVETCLLLPGMIFLLAALVSPGSASTTHGG